MSTEDLATLDNADARLRLWGLIKDIRFAHAEIRMR